MLIRVTGGGDGIRPYLEEGRKEGRAWSREELDERVVLTGDLATTDAVIQSIDSAGDRYFHITLSFREDDVPEDQLREVIKEFEDFAFAAYRPDEYSFYAEAHYPRIKSYTNRLTGEFVERKPHIHIVIPKQNLLTGRPLDLFGKTTQQERFIDACQEHVNNKFGFASPKDHRRIEFTGESEMIARYKGDTFRGRNADVKSALLDAMIERDVRTKEAFGLMLQEFGAVRERNAGKSSAYFNIKPEGYEKGINLRDYVFGDEFIVLSREEKKIVLAREITRSYIDAGKEKRDPALIEATLKEWHDIRAREIKYINSGNRKAYAQWRDASIDEKRDILAQRERAFYAKHDRKSADGQQPGSIERIDANLRTASRALRSAGTALGAVKRDPGNIVDRSAVRAVAAAIRRHEGRARTPRITEQRRPRDNVIGQLQRDISERAQRGSAEPTMAAIKQGLDARRLLSALGASHGVIQSKYEVAKGRDGSDRIVCGKRHLNVSDFLTAEMRLPWVQAERILRDEFVRQQSNAPRRNVPTEPSRSQLWPEFQAWKSTRPTERTAAWQAQRDSEKARKVAIAADYSEAKSAITDNPGMRYADRRSQLSIERMRKVAADQQLAAQIASEREAFRQQWNVRSNELFRTFLQHWAGQGDALALDELRRQRTEPERHDPQQARVSGNGRGEAVYLPAPLEYRVSRNGDVTYSAQGRDVLRDEVRAVTVLQPSDTAVIESGLRLAMAKFGSELTVTGSDEFKQKLVQVAIDQGLRVDFKDPAMREAYDALRHSTKPTERPAETIPTPPIQTRTAERSASMPVKSVTPTSASPTHAASERAKQQAQQRAYDALARRKEQARMTDMPAWLTAQGHRLVKNGTNEYKVHEGSGPTLRLFKSTTDGAWLITDGTHTLDSIGYVQQRDRVDFKGAVERLTGGTAATHQARPSAAPKPKADPPRPVTLRYANEAQGQAALRYLEGRGISRATIEQARKDGMLGFDDRGVVFLGRDTKGDIRSAETRFLKAHTIDGEARTKMNAKGSDRTYSPLLSGDPKHVHLVEGGVDALALRDIHRREHPGEVPPTIIVTGGARTLKWKDNPTIAELLRDAETVSIHKENEKDHHGLPDRTKQADTDAAHEKQMEAVVAIRQGRADGLQFERPAPAFKDLAERNAHEVKVAESKAAEAARQDDDEHMKPRR